MCKEYNGPGEIDPQNDYCGASGKLIKEMAAQAVFNCVYYRNRKGSKTVIYTFNAPTPGNSQWAKGLNPILKFMALQSINDDTWSFTQSLSDREGQSTGNGWYICPTFEKLLENSVSLDDNTMYYFAKE